MRSLLSHLVLLPNPFILLDGGARRVPSMGVTAPTWREPCAPAAIHHRSFVKNHVYRNLDHGRRHPGRPPLYARPWPGGHDLAGPSLYGLATNAATAARQQHPVWHVRPDRKCGPVWGPFPRSRRYPAPAAERSSSGVFDGFTGLYTSGLLH